MYEFGRFSVDDIKFSYLSTFCFTKDTFNYYPTVFEFFTEIFLCFQSNQGIAVGFTFFDREMRCHIRIVEPINFCVKTLKWGESWAVS